MGDGTVVAACEHMLSMLIGHSGWLLVAPGFVGLDGLEVLSTDASGAAAASARCARMGETGA
jgi:hypothetical protein